MDLVRYVPEKGMLKMQREKLGLSQEEVALKAGIAIGQYQKFESGERNISSSSFRIVHAVLAALNLDTSAFNKGEYAFVDVAADDPLRKMLSQV